MKIKLRRLKLKKRPRNKINVIMYMLVCAFVLSLSVGYAALNREIKISGEATFRVEEDIRVTDINLSETINKGLENYTPDYSKDTIKMGVDLNEVTSEVVYNVEITNSGSVAMWIDTIEAPVNNNTNMEFVLEGIGIKQLIQPGDIKSFKVRIKYKEGITLPENTNLDIVIKFNFTKPESILAQGNSGNETSTFYNGTIQKQEVETIEFLPTLEVGDNAIGSWDASYNKDGSVIAWYTDIDNNDLYELYIGGVGEIEAPVNSSNLFRYFNNLTSINFGDYFNTSKVTNMSSMFYNCLSMLMLDVSNFNTKNVTNFGSNIINGMFQNCSSLININLSGWDTSSAIYMGSMFAGCRSLTGLNVSSFNTSNVTNMYGMFRGCSSLTELDLSNFDVSKVNIIGERGQQISLFSSCVNLQKINLSGWNTISMTDMSYMFSTCKALTSLDLSSFNTSNVTNMGMMFYNCASLTELDLSNFDVSNVNTFATDHGMFQECSKLKYLNLSGWNTVKATNMSRMFYNCSSLTELDLSSFNTSNVTNMGMLFYNCSGLTTLDLSNWNTSNVTNMSNMFAHCSKLTNLNISGFNTEKVTSMSSLFDGCSSLTELDLSSFDTSGVVNMSYMFSGCTGLTEINLLNFNTSNVTNMNSMFYNCASLINLDLSSFDTSKVTNMSMMFYTCNSLVTLDLSSFDFSNVSSIANMFIGTSFNPIIYVKDQNAIDFLTQSFPNYNYVIKNA